MSKGMSKKEIRALEKSVNKKKSKNPLIFFLLNLIFGIYLINFKFPIFDIPEFLTPLKDWIVFLGGALLLIAGFRNFFRK